MELYHLYFFCLALFPKLPAFSDSYTFIHTEVGKSSFTVIIQINKIINEEQYKNKLFCVCTTVNLFLPAAVK